MPVAGELKPLSPERDTGHFADRLNPAFSCYTYEAIGEYRE